VNGKLDFVELEFGLHRRDSETYTVELRVSRPDSDADTTETSRFPVNKIDIESLHRQKFDADEHGRLHPPGPGEQDRQRERNENEPPAFRGDRQHPVRHPRLAASPSEAV